MRGTSVAVRRRMITDGRMIIGDECDPNLLTFVLQLWENPCIECAQNFERDNFADT